jgi:ArsR family transcriptional regulator, lead/cadmium/zinc/bismuth-responsive transcriptional repressor
MSTRSYIATHGSLLDDESAAALAETFKVLGDATRVRILDALARSEVAVCDLADAIGLTQSAVSHQLRLLRSMRLVRSRRDGRHIYYTVDDDHIAKLFTQGLEHVQERRDAARPHAGRRGAPDRRPAPRRPRPQPGGGAAAGARRG